MLTSLFPRAHARYASLPVLGRVLEELCVWLHARGFPLTAVRRHVQAAPYRDQYLRRRHLRSLRGCTAARLQACLPRQPRWRSETAYALGRSVLAFLQERGELTAVPPTRTEQLCEGYREYLRRVRGLARRTVQHHAAVAGDLLRFVRYDCRARGLTDLRIAEIEAFVTATGGRVGRITMQSTVAIVRSFLRFLATRHETPPGLD